MLQEFGNFHFGIVANAHGFSLSQTLAGAGAGAFQVFRQGGGDFVELTSVPILCVAGWCGDNLAAYLTHYGYGWGDNPGDALEIMEGYKYQEMEGG